MNVDASSSISEFANAATIVGLVVSIVGLAISIWVLINTLKLKSEFRLFIGVPRLLSKLIDNASNLKKLSRKFDGSPHLIYAELSRIEANVESIKEKDSKAEGAAQQVRLAIKDYRYNPTDRDKSWEVHTQLLGLIERIKNIQEDRLEER